MLYIILALSLTSPEVCYATAPAAQQATQEALVQIQASGWSKNHVGYSIPKMVETTSLEGVRALKGGTKVDPVFSHTHVLPPCRIFGMDP